MRRIVSLLFVAALFFSFAATSYAESYTLTVASSNPSSGVAITASPNDRNGRGSGTTQFTRYYSDTTSITLTAPSSANGNTFQKWQRDGSDYSTNRTITFSLSRNRTMTAIYATSSSTAYTLTVASSNPTSGVAVTVSPADRNGATNGTTQFTRSYNSGSVVTLTAPAGLTGKKFQKWTRGSTDYATTASTSVTMTAATTMTAYYVNDTTAPITTASPAAGSYSGSVNVALTPNETATTYYCTGSSSCTPTTVYTGPIAISASTTLRYYSRDVASNSESVKTATYTITAASAYTLTVASSNPASGVAITVGPADRNGATNGTTQFTRSYNSGTSVNLTAPSASGSNAFQKWQKNGVDAGTAQTISVSMTANTTMTAVFGAPVSAENCKDGIDNNGNGLIDCADSACSSDASCTGAVNTSHRGINSYNGPSTCLGCHSSSGTQVLNSMHGSWLGPTPNVPNIVTDSGKWGQTNNYCTDPQLADFACLKCHVSLAAPVNSQGKVDMSKANLTAADMDCMQCHSTDYRATFMPDQSTATAYTSCVDGSSHTYVVPLPAADGKIHKQTRLDLSPTPGQTEISLARTVTRPTTASCVLKCHAKAGGSDGAKRGDMGSNMSNPTFTADVHLSSAGTAKLVCVSCHAGSSHQIPGRGNDMRGQDTGATMKTCVACHAGKDTTSGHGTTTTNRQAANRHVAKVDCTACHIDYFGKGVSTELSRDWTRPWWNTAGCEGQGAYNGEELRGTNVTPEYRFWNGTSWVYDRNGTSGLTTDLIDGGLAMSYPLGSMSDGKLYPFKIHLSKNPINNASGKTNFDVLKMFMTGCYDEAAVSGLNFIAQSGAYTWTENKAFQLITHGVAPKTEGNNCVKCHTGRIDTSTTSKLDKLGYKTAKPMSDLCNDCHSDKSGDSNYNDFYWVHDKHVRSEGYNCSRCHSFSRP